MEPSRRRVDGRSHTWPSGGGEVATYPRRPAGMREMVVLLRVAWPNGWAISGTSTQAKRGVRRVRCIARLGIARLTAERIMRS